MNFVSLEKGPVIRDLFYGKTKQKQILKNALRFQRQHRATFICTLWSRATAVNISRELFPVLLHLLPVLSFHRFRILLLASLLKTLSQLNLSKTSNSKVFRFVYTILLTWLWLEISCHMAGWDFVQHGCSSSTLQNGSCSSWVSISSLRVSLLMGSIQVPSVL